MNTYIDSFESEEQMEKVLQKIEEHTSLQWNTGEKPTEFDPLDYNNIVLVLDYAISYSYDKRNDDWTSLTAEEYLNPIEIGDAVEIFDDSEYNGRKGEVIKIYSDGDYLVSLADINVVRSEEYLKKLKEELFDVGDLVTFKGKNKVYEVVHRFGPGSKVDGYKIQSESEPGILVVQWGTLERAKEPAPVTDTLTGIDGMTASYVIMDDHISRSEVEQIIENALHTLNFNNNNMNPYNIGDSVLYNNQLYTIENICREAVRVGGKDVHMSEVTPEKDVIGTLNTNNNTMGTIQEEAKAEATEIFFANEKNITKIRKADDKILDKINILSKVIYDVTTKYNNLVVAKRQLNVSYENREEESILKYIEEIKQICEYTDAYIGMKVSTIGKETKEEDVFDVKEYMES